MLEQDRSKFAALLKAIMTEYQREVSTASLHLWWAALERFDYDAVRAAFSAWVQNPDAGQFAPKPADIIRMIEGTTGDKAMVAWSKVEKAVRMVGHYQSVAFDDPIIHRVIDDMGGWISLASTPTDKDLEFRGKEFATRYRALALRGVGDEYPAYLVGASESVNGSTGYRGVDRLVMLGPPALVEQVVRAGGTGRRMAITTARSGQDLIGGAVQGLEDSRKGLNIAGLIPNQSK